MSCIEFFVPGIKGDNMLSSVCVVDECGGVRKARGYCNRHYLQVVFNGQEPTPPRRYDTTARDDQGRKLCVSCMTWRDESCFHKSKKCKDGYASSCAECCNSKRSSVQRHGLTVEQCDAILEAQGGHCVCGSDGPFAVDHDHTCCPGKHGCENCVRGLLCYSCNSTLAFSRDNAEVLRRLADYLDGSKS